MYHRNISLTRNVEDAICSVKLAAVNQNTRRRYIAERNTVCWHVDW